MSRKWLQLNCLDGAETISPSAKNSANLIMRKRFAQAGRGVGLANANTFGEGGQGAIELAERVDVDPKGRIVGLS
jgi:hypothetical protein